VIFDELHNFFVRKQQSKFPRSTERDTSTLSTSIIAIIYDDKGFSVDYRYLGSTQKSQSHLPAP